MPDGDPLLGLSLRVQPSNPQAEQALLGGLLANNRAYDRVGDLLVPGHFADPVHGRIYETIARRVEAGRLADAVTLKAEFDATDELRDVGGSGYLAQLLGAMISPLYLRDYARSIRDAWLRRETIEIGSSAVNAAFGSSADTLPDEIITGAIEQLMRLGEQAGDQMTGAVGLDKALDAAVARAEAAYKGDANAKWLDTGLPTFDRLWGGLWGGQLYYLMARSRTGKSPCMLQIARNVSAQLLGESERTGEKPGHVHIFSLEMTAADVATVNLASTTCWTADQIRKGQVSDWHALSQERDRLSRLPIIIDDAVGLDINALMTRARLVARTRRTRLLMIDHRDLIDRDKDHARSSIMEWVPFLCRRLKALAKTLDIPVICLTQINKGNDRENVRPTLSDLPYDGGQDADAIAALWRPEISMGDDPPEPALGAKGEQAARVRADWHDQRARAKGVAHFGMLKRRFGPMAWAEMRFNGPRMRFEEIGERISDLLEEQ